MGNTQQLFLNFAVHSSSFITMLPTLIQRNSTLDAWARKLCNKKNFFTTYLLAFITIFGYDALVIDVYHGDGSAVRF